MNGGVAGWLKTNRLVMCRLDLGVNTDRQLTAGPVRLHAENDRAQPILLSGARVRQNAIQVFLWIESCADLVSGMAESAGPTCLRQLGALARLKRDPVFWKDLHVQIGE